MAQTRELKTELLKVRITPSERDVLLREFKDLGISYSSWMRLYVFPMLMEQALTRKKIRDAKFYGGQ
jgi:hypothetical protein